MNSGVDICAGQQAGFYRDRTDSLNPGFVAVRCSEKTLRLYTNMGDTMMPNSEVRDFNNYILKEGLSWATFHPEVVLTGHSGIRTRQMRCLIHHAATGASKYTLKEEVLLISRWRIQSWRMMCPARHKADEAYLPKHPVCELFGPSNSSTGEFRIGGNYYAEDLQSIADEYNTGMQELTSTRGALKLLQAALFFAQMRASLTFGKDTPQIMHLKPEKLPED
eukprot:TRINITY_DN13610_c4_g1_i1.p1 TRINITY_DN13610_c4_g1~~TRINITY_DN13610_c4_g1_i1.p1  ORF type:complete len:221 (+),score=27.07 TRINITY_DN13610_c4_g1_i1:81-743(+)